MTVKEMREKVGMSQAAFALYYNIPKRTIENWESGKSKPPVYVLEMLQKVVEHSAFPKEEKSPMAMTVYQLKLNCEDMIREGYGYRHVLMRRGPEELGEYNESVFGLWPMDDSDEYIILD